MNRFLKFLSGQLYVSLEISIMLFVFMPSEALSVLPLYSVAEYGHVCNAFTPIAGREVQK